MSLEEERRKALKDDNDIFYYPIRYISTIITMYLAKTKITPLQVTWIHFIIGIIAAILFSFGDYTISIIAFILYFISILLDMVDGELARYKGTRSEVSVWLDHVSDYILIFMLIGGISIGNFRINGDVSMLFIALMALIISASAGVTIISKRTNNKLKESKAIRLPLRFKYSKKVHIGISVVSSLLLIIGPIIKMVEVTFMIYIAINSIALIRSFTHRIKSIKEEFNE